MAITTTFDFNGATIVITGAAQGIGAAVAQYFLDGGANVAALDVSAAGLRERWNDVDGSRLRTYELDVSDSDACTSTIDAILEWSGSIWALVNNAGITRDGVVWKLDDAAWSDVLSVHLTGAFNLTRAVIPSMRARSGGRVINVTSYSGIHGNIGQANYAAAKAGIIGFTKTVAKEVAAFGITANAIAPNALTSMVAAVPLEKRVELERGIPLGRYADPLEIAPALAFLASESAAYITGVVLPVDGGMSM